MAALTNMIGALAAGDVTDATCDLLSSTTLVALFKKSDAEIEALKEKKGAEYRQPQRPLGMGSAIPKLAANCVLKFIEPAIEMIAGADQFAVNTKGGYVTEQWILQVIMEAEPDLAKSCLDASNAFGDEERPCIRAPFEANVGLHPAIPLYDVLYTGGSGEMWYYDNMGNFIICVLCIRGVRQGCFLGTFILCVTNRLVYDALLALLGPNGFLFSYADDVYMGGLLSESLAHFLQPLASMSWLCFSWIGGRRRLNSSSLSTATRTAYPFLGIQHTTRYRTLCQVSWPA